MNPAEHFASELRLAREARGMSQVDLAKAINFSKSAVAMVETCQRPPTREFCDAVDGALGTGGRFDRMRRDLLVPEANPTWFRPWVGYEQEATEIRWCEPLLIPGLVQTEEYALALLSDGSPGQEAELLAARMDRQRVLETTSLTAVVDESVLGRQVGDVGVMYRQLTHLVSVRAVVQVLPAGSATYRHLLGSFALAIVDGVDVAYVDTPARGFVLAEPEVASRLRRNWDIIRGEALPRQQSRDVIVKAAQRWNNGG